MAASMKELTAPTDNENYNSQSKRRLSRIAAVAQFLSFPGDTRFRL
jgi:hypothetical protein